MSAVYCYSPHHWHAGWTTEGDSAFNELSGSSPLSIRQQALRGIAKVALERGNKKEARHQYERILGKSLIGRGPPAAHWAHSEYAWLLFEDGNLEVSIASLLVLCWTLFPSFSWLHVKIYDLRSYIACVVFFCVENLTSTCTADSLVRTHPM